MEALILKHRHGLGDTLVLSGLIRDIQKCYPGRFRVDTFVNGKSILQNNPYLTRLLGTPAEKGARWISCDYGKGIIHVSRRETVHFLNYFIRDFNQQTGLNVQLTKPTPDWFFSEEEKVRVSDDRYWVINAGGKSDITAKFWSFAKYQRVVDMLRERGIACVQIGGRTSSKSTHIHTPLARCVDKIGQTGIRDLGRLIRDSEGVICGITFAMHLAAAVERPCVVLGGAFEAWWWEAYVRENRGLGDCAQQIKYPHQYLHSIRQLPCCAEQHCGIQKVYTLGAQPTRGRFCTRPVHYPERSIAACMDLITPEHVVNAVMQYYDNSLPPITVVPQENVLQPTVVTPAVMQPMVRRLTGDKGDQHPIIPVEPRFVPVQAAVANRMHRPARFINKRTGAVQGLSTRTPVPPAIAAAVPPSTADVNVWRHSTLGGKVTIFVLCYGDSDYFYSLHRRCIDSILASVPAEFRELRVGANACGARTLAYLDALLQSGDVRKVYKRDTTQNPVKYPAMREMFYDESCPIETAYLIWFDDDSWIHPGSPWFAELGQSIATNHDRGCRMYGPVKTWNASPSQLKHYEKASWYKKRPFSDHRGQEVANSRMIRFAVGAFWALETAAMIQCDIPDRRMRVDVHNGGDYCIGAQLWQHRFDVKNFSLKKELVCWSDADPRGASLNRKHFGADTLGVAE